MTKRNSAAPDTATGPWRPTWSPGLGSPDLPQLTVIHDAHDDHAFMAAALAAHAPALGCITVHPTPVATAPASLAHDLLRSMDKHLPPIGSEDDAYWTGSTDTAWRAVAAWIQTLHIHHVIVTRVHRISSRHFEHLFALRELTGIRLTLLSHGQLTPALTEALAVLPHLDVHTLAGARRAVDVPAPPPPADRYAWWEAAAQFPPRVDEPCLLMPRRRPVGRDRLDAAARRLGRTVLPLPAGGHFPPEPDRATALFAQRLHTRIAHPVHAAALATQVLTGRPITQVQLPAAHTEPGRDPLAPPWAADLIASAHRFRRLEGHTPDGRGLRLAPWDQAAVAEAARACGLFGSAGPPRAESAPTAGPTHRSGGPPAGARTTRRPPAAARPA
ncbi:hypothetical protein ACFZB9_36210 [Kitasatospora sp. NPDC008050]|uniref:hypothetical protein n=1 Tax=Kitasatospora sp. NPDC008050 TaxID=3364021 RepID=UPI0036E8E477